MVAVMASSSASPRLGEELIKLHERFFKRVLPPRRQHGGHRRGRRWRWDGFWFLMDDHGADARRHAGAATGAPGRLRVSQSLGLALRQVPVLATQRPLLVLAQLRVPPELPRRFRLRRGIYTSFTFRCNWWWFCWSCWFCWLWCSCVHYNYINTT